MINRTVKSILFIWIILFSSLLYANKKLQPLPDNVYTEEQQSISVDFQHPEFIIKLKSNPSTGYAWYLREHDANLISAIKHTFDKPSQKLIGAPGHELWTFKVKPAGFTVPQQTVIRFIYTRSQQGFDSPTQVVFRVTTLAHDASIKNP